MFCDKCGALLQDDEIYCHSCGANMMVAQAQFKKLNTGTGNEPGTQKPASRVQPARTVNAPQPAQQARPIKTAVPAAQAAQVAPVAPAAPVASAVQDAPAAQIKSVALDKPGNPAASKSTGTVKPTAPKAPGTAKVAAPQTPVTAKPADTAVSTNPAGNVRKAPQTVPMSYGEDSMPEVGADTLEKYYNSLYHGEEGSRKRVTLSPGIDDAKITGKSDARLPSLGNSDDRALSPVRPIHIINFTPLKVTLKILALVLALVIAAGAVLYFTGGLYKFGIVEKFHDLTGVCIQHHYVEKPDGSLEYCEICGEIHKT